MDLENNQFVKAFEKEFDAYLRNNYAARCKAGLKHYKPKCSKNEICADEYDFNDDEILFLGGIILAHDFNSITTNLSPSDLICVSDSTTSEKGLLTEQWVRLMGSDEISHTTFVYRTLQNKKIPQNTLIPLLLKIGVDMSIIRDRMLSESEFIEKYKDLIWLPTTITDQNCTEIHKLIFLLNCDAVQTELNKPNGMRFLCNYDLETLFSFTVYYLILSQKYPSDYECFVQICLRQIDSINLSPAIYLLCEIVHIHLNLNIYYERLFHLAHNSDFEIREHFTKRIIKLGSDYTFKIIDIYQHYCIQNRITPNPDIIAIKAEQFIKDPKKDFEKSFNQSSIDKDKEYHLGLKLTGGNVFELYQILINGYVDRKDVTIEQLCYALTGRIRPEHIHTIDWKADRDELALLINILYLIFDPTRKKKPQTKFCKIFSHLGKEPKDLTSRCSRIDPKKQSAFGNQIKEALKSK